MATPERQFSPEERASFLGWRFGSTLDWASIILTEIGYPVEENRWFVDAVCGVYQRSKAHYKDQGVPIPHGALAKRAQRFKNKSQASDLVRSALERDAEWSRLKRMMIFDIERPKPHERMGRDKRAATKYTDYLTPAAVWAQGCEQSIKRADPAAWKNSKYRGEKRQEILAEAVKMLPQFESVADMPPVKEKAEPKEQTLSEYVEAQQARELAARRRIVDKVTDGELTDTDEIDARLAALDVYYSRAKAQLEKDYNSARAVLLGMRSTRLVTPLRFTDPEETAAEVEEKLGTAVGETGPAGWLQDTIFSHKKGKVGLTLLVEDENPLSGASSGRSNDPRRDASVRVRDPSSSPPSNGSNTIKGSREVRR
jgi:uncharacterized small protein (DUF1192 family)